MTPKTGLYWVLTMADQRVPLASHQRDGGVLVADVQILQRVRQPQRLGVALVDELGRRFTRYLPLRSNRRDDQAQRLEPQVAQQIVGDRGVCTLFM